MYKINNNRQLERTDFNQPIGLTMDLNNRWVRLAAVIPWEKYEHKYARLFIGSKVGNVAKPFRMALGSLIIQQKLSFSNRELVEEITENPYLQYFIGLPGNQQERPFDPSAMTITKIIITPTVPCRIRSGTAENVQPDCTEEVSEPCQEQEALSAEDPQSCSVHVELHPPRQWIP